MKEALAAANEALHSIVWGPFMLILLIGVGIYFTIRTGFFQIRYWPMIWKCTIGRICRKKVTGENGAISSFQAAATSLAGCIGTGNIVGVATALVSGGAGALFWMWVSSFFGMITKYAEILLAVHYRKKIDSGEVVGGPMYYLSAGLGQKWLGSLFAVFCVLASFGIGNMTQINSIAESVSAIAEDSSRFWIGMVAAVLVGMVILGGVKRIAKISAVTVPFFALFYLSGSILILLFRLPEIPHAFEMIFADAFDFRSAGGGILGYLSMNAVRFGFARGVFSNEAGMGSGSIAHGASENQNEVEEGMWGIFEVFFDTILMCTITGLVILTTGVLNSGLNGAKLTASAFSSLFGTKFADWFLAISVSMFAFATLIGWFYYGESCVKFLCEKKSAVRFYQLIYLACIVLGAVMELQFVWSLSDTFNGLMAIPNLIGLVGMQKTICGLTKKYRIGIQEEKRKKQNFRRST